MLVIISILKLYLLTEEYRFFKNSKRITNASMGSKRRDKQGVKIFCWVQYLQIAACIKEMKFKPLLLHYSKI